MRADPVEHVGRRLMQVIKVPQGGFSLMTFTLPSGEKVLRVLLQPKYSSALREIPQEMEGVTIITEIQDVTGYTLH